MMRFHRAALLLVLLVGCSESEGAPEVMVKAASDSIEIAPALPALDLLIAQLDSARGFYWPRTERQLELTNASLNAPLFRAHGRPAVQRLIDCMTDTTRTSTYNADQWDYKYPRGALCYEVLRAITDVDMSRQVGINMQSLIVIPDMDHVGWKLERAQRAWRVVYNTNAYRLKSISTQ